MDMQLLSGIFVFSAEIPPYATLRAGTAFGMTLISGNTQQN
jgi:hypothetical protein